MTSLAIMDLLPKGGQRSGSLRFDGTELSELGNAAMRRMRGDRIAMIFQDPLSSLNPYYTVGLQIEEAYRSEEHTSELQSRGQLVCRLLLEKKKDEQQTD